MRCAGKLFALRVHSFLEFSFFFANRCWRARTEKRPASHGLWCALFGIAIFRRAQHNVRWHTRVYHAHSPRKNARYKTIKVSPWNDKFIVSHEMRRREPRALSEWEWTARVAHKSRVSVAGDSRLATMNAGRIRNKKTWAPARIKLVMISTCSAIKSRINFPPFGRKRHATREKETATRNDTKRTVRLEEIG